MFAIVSALSTGSLISAINHDSDVADFRTQCCCEQSAVFASKAECSLGTHGTLDVTSLALV